MEDSGGDSDLKCGGHTQEDSEEKMLILEIILVIFLEECGDYFLPLSKISA